MKWLAVAALLTLAGCTEPAAGPEPTWHGRDLDPDAWNNWQLKPCQIIELDFYFENATTFAWDWISENRVPVEFVIHTHAGEGIVELVNTTGDEHTGSMTFQAKVIYSLVWTGISPETAELYHQHPPWGNGILGAAPPTRCT